MTEAELQRDAVQLLNLAGYTVLIANAGRKAGSSGVFQSCGIPDLLIGHPSWGASWLGIELKTETGKLRKEQKDLYDQEMIRIARSVDEVARIVINHDNWRQHVASIAKNGGHKLAFYKASRGVEVLEAYIEGNPMLGGTK